MERGVVSQCMNGVVEQLKKDNNQDVVTALTSLCMNKKSDDNIESEQVLDKKNLQLALMSLIQDERFLDLIHAQYVKVSNARSKKGDGK